MSVLFLALQEAAHKQRGDTEQKIAPHKMSGVREREQECSKECGRGVRERQGRVFFFKAQDSRTQWPSHHESTLEQAPRIAFPSRA